MGVVRRRGLLLAICASALWGTVPVAGTIALGGITAGALSLLRLAAAAVFLALLLRSRGVPLGRPSRALVAGGLAIACNYACYMWGVERAGPATSQVLIQTAPLFLILLGVAVLGERLTPRQWAGAAVAVLGVGLVSWEADPGEPRRAAGIALLLLAALTWGVYGVIHKRIGRTEASGPTVMWIFVIAALGNVPAAAAEPLRTPDWVQAAAIAYLCLNTVGAYWSFAESLRHIDASLAAVICTLGPVVTFLLLLVTNALDQDRIPYEPFSVLKLAGAALVIGGVAAAVGRARA